ncbi:MAG: chromophore lyase CpcT/CpeT [Saprospiraceae bacterium]|nr:chromophore lyase CpcT/CpeT [Saprospiraceae bacterium]
MRAFVFTLWLICQLFVTTSLTAQSGSLEELTTWMTGTFTSEAQARKDSDYYAISLIMTPIWQNRYPGQHWLYVEQALASRLDKPYRQRVYQVEGLLDGTFRSAVYLIPDEEESVGKSTDATFFDQWEPEDLDILEGCAVQLTYADGVYTGSTRGKNCSSSLRGASYAVSTVTISRDRIVSWDQGFDALGVQVWGAEKGGYVFDPR